LAVAHVKSAAGSNSTAGTPNDIGIVGAIPDTTKNASFSYTASATGNAVFFLINWGANQTVTSPAVTLSATGWTLTQIGGLVNGGVAAGYVTFWWGFAPNTSATTFHAVATGTTSATGAFWAAIVDEFSGTDNSNPVDNSNQGTGSGTPTVSITPVASNCGILVATTDSVTAVGAIGGTTATKGGDDGSADWSEYRILTGGAGVAQSCTFTGSGSYSIGVVSVKPAGVGPTIGSVPSGTALTVPAFSAKFLFFDNGDFSTGS